MRAGPSVKGVSTAVLIFLVAAFVFVATFMRVAAFGFATAFGGGFDVVNL